MSESAIDKVRSWSFEHGLPEQVTISIELFPPKTAEALARLFEALDRLKAVNPAFYSVTFGAGGTTQEGTFSLVQEIRRRLEVDVAAHLTCVSMGREEVDELAHSYWESGVRHIVALRGDPSEGVGGRYAPRADGYAYAADLVAGLKRLGDFEIDVAFYPETHPEAVSAEFDLDNLLRKVDAGATRIIGQYCFDTDQVLRFRDRVRDRGIAVPIVPGVMPIHRFSQVKRFSAACGASIPEWLEQLFEGVEEGSDVHNMVAASVAAEQCRRLAAEGLTELHLYALNRAELTLAVCRMLGLGGELREAA